MKSRLLIAMSLAALMIGGCGGGGTSTSAPAPTGTQTVQLGPAQVSFVSKPSSQIGVSGQAVSVYGMAGTTFSDVIVDPAQTLSNTSILFAGTGDTNGLWVYANGQVNPLGGVGFTFATRAVYTNDGHILFVSFDPASNLAQLFECNYDGSGAHKLTSSQHISAGSRIAWSPLNNFIAYDDGSLSTYIANSNGTGETLRISGGNQPCFSPDGKNLAFQDTINNTISTIPVGGGAIKTIATSQAGDTLSNPSYSPDGNFIVFTDTAMPGASSLEIFSITGKQAGFDNPAGVTVDNGIFSPDGSQVAYIATTPSMSSQFLDSSTYTGAGIATLVSSSTGRIPAFPSWSPFPGLQRFVAASIGTVMPSASGFLFGQAGDKFGGFVAFSAKTPADATITSEGTPSGTAPYSFDIHADQITSLSFTNGLYSAVSTVSTGSYSDVLVSVSGVSGQITFVTPILPKRANGALAKPVITHTGGNTVYSGSFAGLWNGRGKNLAPNGLSEYRLDAKGNLLGFK